MPATGVSIPRPFALAALVLACIFLVAARDASAAISCPPGGEESAGKVGTWAQLQSHYHRYGRGPCDKDALAEGYSAAVQKLLLKWNGVAKLPFLTKSDPEFRAFILRHVDASWQHENHEIVATHARKKCPKSAAKLCRDIVNAVEALPPPSDAQDATAEK